MEIDQIPDLQLEAMTDMIAEEMPKPFWKI